LASILFLPKVEAAVGDLFDIDGLKYTVITEDQASQTGTVSVETVSKEISGDIVIPPSVVNGENIYSVTLVRASAFEQCAALKSVVLPESVTSIGDSAFFGCSSLTSITIPEGITSIEDYTFLRCSSLTSIIIPDSVTYIGYQAFSWCTHLTDVTIGGGVTRIGTFAFSYCSSLTSIVIPKSVTSIAPYAFQNCNWLTAVYFEGNAPKIISGNAFYSPSIIYYKAEKIRWTNPWDGRPTALWIEAPKITEQPQSQTVLEGDSVTISVSAIGTEPFNYQWYRDGVAIENAVNASYTIESVTAEDLGNYTVVVSNEEGEETSDIAALSYLKAPIITVHPVSLTVDAGTQTALQVEALDAESYQWYMDDLLINGATNALYNVDAIKGINVGTYKVIVSNRAGTATSLTASLTLTKPYRATATAQVVNGFVVGLNVIDGGWGYTREPKIKIIDETGLGAIVHCIIENGVVTQIIVDKPGSKYSGETAILIGSPRTNSSLEIGTSELNAGVRITMHLALGMTYQLWSSTDCVDWTQEGEPFTAEEEEMDILREIEGPGRFFKLQEI